jgi:hypothetical protein
MVLQLPVKMYALLKSTVSLGDVFHAECELLTGHSFFLKQRASILVGDGGNDLIVFVDPERLDVWKNRPYVQLYVDPVNNAPQSDPVLLSSLWSAVDHNRRSTVPRAWISAKKLSDPFPQFIRTPHGEVIPR